MDNLQQYIDEQLTLLDRQDNLRQLNTVECRGKYVIHEGNKYLNLSSNDYLGLSDIDIQRDFLLSLADGEEFIMSNPSSRLITGNSPHYDLLEHTIAALYPDREALVLSSGFLANCGVPTAVTRKGDLILADKLVHASIIDGLRQCEAEWTRFRHNDMNHLESLLKKQDTQRTVWVVTESLFSMDGDKAPLKELVQLKERYGFHLYLDEAHSFGVYGHGAGLAAQHGVDSQVDILIATLGKAMSSAGSFVVCSPMMRKWLINNLRTLIFSTAMPPMTLLWSDYLIRHMKDFEPRREQLHKLVGVLDNRPDQSHIIPVIVGENNRALELSRMLRDHGYWVSAVRYPTVAKGTARLRVSLSAALEVDDLTKFHSLCNTIG